MSLLIINFLSSNELPELDENFIHQNNVWVADLIYKTHSTVRILIEITGTRQQPAQLEIIK